MYKLLCIIVVLIITSLQVAIAEEVNKEADINADDLIYIPEQDIFIATGHVKIEESNKILYADQVTYNVKKDEVVAKGNVKLQDSGNVFYADNMVLEERMSKGTAKQLRGWLANETSIISDQFTKYNNDKYVLQNVKYSACGLCTKNNNSRLAWQFVTKDTTLDKKSETILHRHLWMEVYGNKLLYLPALYHPMPGAQKKSGFLQPTYGSDTQLGTYISIPYYYVIAPNADITATPTLYTEKSPRLEMEWRHLSHRSSSKVNGSGTYTKDTLKPNENKKTFRWDMKVQTSTKLDENWTSGADISRTSDDTYQRLYHISDATVLPSNIYTRYLDQNSYTDIKGLVFQDLRPNMQTSSEPFIVPYLQNSNNGYLESIEGRYKWNSALRIMQRNSNYISDRLATSKLAWEKDYTTNNGHKFILTPSLRLDGYVSHNIPSQINPTDPNSQLDKTKGRFIPQIMGEWKYPLAGKVINSSYTILEPIVQVISSPIVYNGYEIPNEDSKELDINSENLFSDNHFSGYDRVEGGLRSNYGINSTTYHNSGMIFNGLFGQSMHQHKDTQLYVANSGMDKKFSDYVGKLRMVHPSHWYLTYRFRINKKISHMNYNEIVAGYTHKIFHIDTTFISTPAAADSNGKRREISVDAGLNLNKNWEVLFHTRRNLRDIDPTTNSRFIDLSGKLIYTGDCVKVVTAVGKRFIRDRDIKPDSYITVNVLLRTLTY